MTKATETALTIFAISSIYFALYTKLIPTPQIFYNEILPFLPFWALVSFGSYSLFTLGWGIITFKDKSNKYEELKIQIEEAKAFYKSKGIDID
ncbi:uncharacterized protein KGF55_001142 [Candida pseudojiufengensis]|uniref:uncharacterized protein n=1 Tax=Candida pseudojiufengensis TaxID=497109 RepID=UPI0022257563|nr:uncharacterized protein KGF55_001142 [Candida pseudojiufengensis]KAI5965779.1 hypothetical protein KGF55_001142 [Candida pseudojiufengensis]